MLPSADSAPEQLGPAYEALLAPAERRRHGAFYTPADVAGRVVAAALDGLSAKGPLAVCDPAAGGGAFLLAAGRALGTRAALVGCERDRQAAAVARHALALLATETRLAEAPAVRVADAFDLAGPADLGRGEPFDLVVGNPPFLGQLARATARDARERARLRQRFGPAATGYVDTALLFLLLGLELVRPGGRVAMILPESVLGARHAAPARAELGRRARPLWLWRDDGEGFAAGVRTCALVLERRGRSDPPRWPLRRARGRAFVPEPPLPLDDAGLRAGHGWARWLADGLGAPDLELPPGPPLADWCTATADFRDQYYGLVPYVADGLPAAMPPLVTVGLVDPARCWWGTRAARFGGRRHEAPRVDLPRLRAAGGPLAAWAEDRLRPKVLVATQTRVLEAAVDERGAWLPSVPAITVVPRDPDRLWHVAAALAAPVASCLALRAAAGTGLGVGTIRVAARGLTALPAPAPGAAWDEAASAFRQASRARGPAGWASALRRSAAAACRAHGLDAEQAAGLTAWWAERLPRWRG